MHDEEHRQLAWLLMACKAKVLVSGYSFQLYEQLYGTWRRDEKATTTSGRVGAVSRTEILWMNF